MMDIGTIQKSSSPWVSAVVLVRKKDGGLQFCIDLCRLNAHTIKDAYSLPRIDEALDCLGGARIFTSLDLKSGYWQVEMDEDLKELTAFTVGPLGFYECNRMPFGLTNAPATFQCLMESCLGDLHLNWCIIYLDDIIVFADTPEEHVKRLRDVFEKLAEAGLKLKPSKCEFFKSCVNYLGHVISKEGIECDPKKIEAVKNWPIPVTVTDVRSFLGFTNHYHRFIQGYAKITHSLNKLISGDNANYKKKKVKWTRECQVTFDELKNKCTQTPILAYANYKKPFIVHTDASELGLGAVLYQRDDANVKRVIAYASRTLTASERKYPAHKLEFLALKWSVTDQFHEYLYGGLFEVYTDNNPLTYILTTAKLDDTGQRWIAKLANYDFQLFYKAGKTNVEADALSRLGKDNYQQIPMEVVKAIATSVQLGDLTDFIPTSDLIITKSLQAASTTTMSNTQWEHEQRNDPIIRQVLDALIYKKKFSNYDDNQVKALLRHRERLVIRNKLLYRKYIDSATASEILQFILPQQYRLQALRACHDNVGHLGIERTGHLLKDHFYWPNMQNDVKKHIQQCPRCLQFKTSPERVEMYPIEATHPWELIHMDFLTIEAPKNSKSTKDINLLIITDHFTHYAQAIVTSSQKASVVAKTLWDQFFMHYRLPEKIL